MLAVEEKCKRLKEKIEEAKAKKDPSASNAQVPVTENEIQNLEEKVKFMESQLAQEEKQYKTEIYKQQELINKLNEDISILNLQLKEKDQEIRINELKLKELKRISKHNQLAPMKIEGRYDKRSTSAKMNIREDKIMNRPNDINTIPGKPKAQLQKSSLNKRQEDYQQQRNKSNYNAVIKNNPANHYGSYNNYNEY